MLTVYCRSLVFVSICLLEKQLEPVLLFVCYFVCEGFIRCGLDEAVRTFCTDLFQTHCQTFIPVFITLMFCSIPSFKHAGTLSLKNHFTLQSVSFHVLFRRQIVFGTLICVVFITNAKVLFTVECIFETLTVKTDNFLLSVIE